MKPLVPFGELPPTDTELSISLDKRRYGKSVTLIQGFDPRTTDIDALVRELKQHVAAGGTRKDDAIELQGEHVQRVTEFLRRRGFTIK